MPTVFDAIQERDFLRQTKELAALFGYLFYHTHRSQFSPAGFPDCLFVRGTEPPIYAELKTEKGKLSPDQRTWLLALVTAGQRVYLWRPSSLDQIIKVLR